MDIVAFVGLAACGPLHRPVVIEDVVRFREIFGGAYGLAWDAATGQQHAAYLGFAVEAFFRNGGRRCWVVRVAQGAVSNCFPLPGMVRADNWRPALARARCEGSWSDVLRVGTMRLNRVLSVLSENGHGFRGQPGSYSLDVAVAPESPRPGDLLQLSFGDSGPLLFLVVQTVETVRSGQRVTATQGYWFLRHEEPDSPPVAISAVLLAPDGESPLPLLDVRQAGESTQHYEVMLNVPLEEAPTPGDLLRVDFASGQHLLLPVTEVAEITSELSPPGRAVWVTSTEGVWPVEESLGLARARAWQQSAEPSRQEPLTESLTLALLVWAGEELHARLDDLAFSEAHPNFWAGLPVDAELFRLPDSGRGRPALSPLEARAFEPRFPLAGPEEPAALYLPLGMPLVPHHATSQEPLGPVVPDTALQRDGLVPFSADLFLDAEVALHSSRTLLAQANHKYYIQNRPLSGLHSLLPLSEVTLIAVPDAVQRGWEKTTDAPPTVLAAPRLDPVQRRHGQKDYDLSWSAVVGATTYTVQEAADPAFMQPVTRYAGEETTIRLSGDRACPQRSYYRVRAGRGNEVSPWSNTEDALIPQPDFIACDATLLPAPMLEPVLSASPEVDDVTLRWSVVMGATDYTLEEASDPAFSMARVIYRGDETAVRVIHRRDAVYYYRVRAQHHDVTSAWSNTQHIVPFPRHMWVVKREKDYHSGDLLAIQRALLRFCAARGDLLAVLTLPGHYREEESVAHVTTLAAPAGTEAAESTGSGRVRVIALSADEERTLSFAAMYHPWVIEREHDTARLRGVPPDGAACAIIATHAMTQGAWIAPANVVLKGVVSLEPDIDLQAWSSLFAAQVNVIRQEARGFLPMGADTLSVDTDVRPINVRRLLILLRRLALREGMTYVFQPNDAVFRRVVQHKFEQLLAFLYTRGAFAGETPDMAYQVVTDASLNTPESLAAGRFFVDLRVAPSQPLVFLTVRLVQMGQEGLVIQEV